MQREGDSLVLPGLATAHSHAFQRALRGRTERARGTFWSWREQMFRLADALDPESIYDVSRFAFVELAMSGVTAVGEFHYVHHQPGGAPYAERTVLADAVIRAARDAGLRIALLRVAYHRGGLGRAAEGAQARFSDPSPDDVLRDVETLAARYAGDPCVTVGVAPHSTRAVPPAWLAPLGAYARSKAMVLSSHVAEQPREVWECLAETGRRPVELLADEGLLDARFVGVHVTHLSPHEVGLFGGAKAFACICRTTERDLGDGFPDARALVAAGARLCTGIDSHSVTDVFEEARAIELDARPVRQARHVAADADALFGAISADAYAAIGMSGKETEDRVVLDLRDPALAGSADDLLPEAVIFSASPRAVREVTVAGRAVVKDGVHVAYDEARVAFEKTLRRLAT